MGSRLAQVAAVAMCMFGAIRSLIANGYWVSQQRNWLATAPTTGSVVLTDSTPLTLRKPTNTRLVCGFSAAPPGKIFLAEMQTETGRRAIVAIDLLKKNVDSTGEAARYDIVVRAHSRASYARGCSDFHQNIVQGALNFLTEVPLEVCAGVIDPSDASHATIVFRQSSATQALDVWLRSGGPDGFVVKVEPRADRSPKFPDR